jgi:hypothetical protein
MMKQVMPDAIPLSLPALMAFSIHGLTCAVILVAGLLLIHAM